MFLIVLIGLIIRLVLAPLVTYTFDFTGWALVMQNIQSGNGLYDLAGYYYSPPWGYYLAAIAELSDILGIDVYGERIPEALSVEWYEWYFNATATNPAFNLVVKMPMVISDLIAGYLIYWIVSDLTGDKRKSTIAFALWFLCPFVISVGCIGGQFDSLAVVFTLLTYIFLRKERFFLAGTMFSLAFLTKLFPALLLFVFVAYIYCKHREGHIWAHHLAYAIFGFMAMSIIVLLPNLIEGNVGDCFSFITSRASNGMGGGTGEIVQYLTVVAYVAILVISIVLAYHMARTTGKDLERRFMMFCTLTLGVLFLYPAAPQYILLLLPAVLIWYIVYGGELKKPLILLMIGTTLFSLASNFTLLLSMAEFTDLVSIHTVMDLIDWYQQPVLGLSKMGWQYYIGGVLQWVAVLWIVVVLLKEWRIGAGGSFRRTGTLSDAPPAFMLHRKITSRQKCYLVFGGAYCIACVCMYAIVRLCDIPSSVYDGYYPYAEAMLDSVKPYSEMVYVYGGWHDWEYPPLAYFFLAIPGLVGHSAAGYQAAFIAMTAVFFIIGLYCCEVIAKETGRSRFRLMLIFTVMMMLMFEFMADRYDIIPVILTLAAITFAIKERYEWSFVMLALGTLTKLYPVILMPILLIYLLSKREYKHAVKGIIYAVIAVAIVIGGNMLAGVDPFAFINYHTERPLEIESLYASILSFIDLFVDLDISVSYSYGSDNLVGSLADSIGSVGLTLMCILVLISYIAYIVYLYRHKDREDLTPSFLSAMISMTTFILFCTVFSGQYMMWLIPFILVYLVFEKNRNNSKMIFWVFIIAEVLTQVNFGVNFGMRGEGEELSAIGILIIFARNIVMMFMLYVSVRILTGKEVSELHVPTVFNEKEQ